MPTIRLGSIFTDECGRPIDASGRPVLPGRGFVEAAQDLDIPAGVWSHPTGERLDPHWVHFNERAS